MTKSRYAGFKVGDLVKFAEPLYKIKKSHYAGIWLWKIGIIIKIDSTKKRVTVLSAGKLHVTSERLTKVNSEEE